MSSEDTYFKNLIIYHFSGTGNARKSAEWIIQVAKEAGLNTWLYKMDRATQPEVPDLPEGKTLIGFCYPTHGFNAAPKAISYISKFPKIKNARCFLLNTRAGLMAYKLFIPGMSGLATIFPALILILKGFRINALKPVDLPSNWISLHPGLNQKTVHLIYRHWKKNVVRFAEKIIHGKRIWRDLYSLPVDLFVAPIAIGYYFVGRFAIAKSFIATNDCTSCRKCEKQCPVNAIKMKGKYPFWTHKCESCMRCMNNCPERAIETVHGVVIPLWYFGWSIAPPFVFTWLIRNNLIWLPDNPFLREVIYTIIWSIIFLFFAYTGYRIIFFLMRFRFINKIVAYTSLTKYKFWRRYKAPDEY